MVALTTQQRDLIHKPLDADSTVATADIAQDIHLASRQADYRLKPFRTPWTQRKVVFKRTPDLGTGILCSSVQQSDLLHKFDSPTDFQPVLTSNQHQQLFLLCLLTADDPLILNGLQHIAAVSRPTVLSDLDLIEDWAHSHNPNLILARGRKDQKS